MLPKFNLNFVKIKDELVLLIDHNLSEINKILDNVEYTWDNLMQPLDELAANLEKLWAPVCHLNGVCNSDEIRKAYDICLPILTEYSTKIGHNIKLYEAVKNISENNLNNVQKKIINDTLLDFKLSGVALTDEKKIRFQEIEQQLSELSNRFSNNIIDSTKVQHFQLSRIGLANDHSGSVDSYISNRALRCISELQNKN